MRRSLSLKYRFHSISKFIFIIPLLLFYITMICPLFPPPPFSLSLSRSVLGDGESWKVPRSYFPFSRRAETTFFLVHLRTCVDESDTMPAGTSRDGLVSVSSQAKRCFHMFVWARAFLSFGQQQQQQQQQLHQRSKAKNIHSIYIGEGSSYVPMLGA